jgi:CubicO group peptidase (beta-lactamase class C family)
MILIEEGKIRLSDRLVKFLPEFDNHGKGQITVEQLLRHRSGIGDYLDEEAFWGVVESARETATALAGRIREGDIHHDPRGGDCPTWCDLWPMCRIERP